MINEPLDIITYENREEMIADLKRRRYSPNWIKEQLEHEDAHMKKAVELGYKPKYCLGIAEDLGFEKIHKLGVTLNRTASDEDLIAILTAPRELSNSDKEDLRKLNRQEEGKNGN